MWNHKVVTFKQITGISKRAELAFNKELETVKKKWESRFHKAMAMRVDSAARAGTRTTRLVFCRARDLALVGYLESELALVPWRHKAVCDAWFATIEKLVKRINNESGGIRAGCNKNGIVVFTW